LNDDDYTFATHRSQGAAVAKGLDLNKVAAELLFRADGQNKGYGGTMHIADPSKGFLGANGIVGGGWHLAAGAAWAGVVRGDKRVAVTFAGDGAANSPYFFNTVRNAVLYKIPAIFVIENNQYNGDIAYRDCSPVENLADYVFGLKVPAFTIDGNDVASVYATAKEAVDRARAGGGPTVIEGVTYRWYDHRNFAGTKAGVDAAWGLPYRSDLELKQWMAKDPIPRFRQFLIEKKLATESELAAIEAAHKPKIEAAFEFARNSPLVKPEMGLKNLYNDRDLIATQFFNRKGLAT
jgi:pyruvate dehydrogenase E1 component alpha subunit